MPKGIGGSTGGRVLRIVFLLVGMMMLGATRALAQFPGELAGTVTDAATGAPVEAATVELGGSGSVARTDASGAFRLRGLEPGDYRVAVRRAGYATREAAATIRNGLTARLDVALHPVPVALQALRVTADASRAAGTTMGRAEIEASGARTAADVVERAGGVVVRGTGPTGERTISIRGSAADEVLVLVDGAPLNDPVTGSADLSAVPAGDVERVTVLPGARTARYGPRAQAGVVLIETRAARARQAAELSAGSLGERSGRGEVGAALGRGAWSAGAHLRRIGGGFDYVRDVNDPTVVRRVNAGLREWSAFGALSSPLAGGELRLRGGWDALERGLPGLGHTPSPDASEELGRGRASAAWRRAGERTSLAMTLSGSAQRVRFSDPAPPFGLPYDDTTRVRTGVARVDAERLLSESRLLRSLGGGVETGVQHVEAGALSTTAPRTRTDFGAFGHAGGALSISRKEVALSAEARADRDGVTGDWFVSRALSASTVVGALRVQLANRSSFTPPSLGDQFFREGVGVVPNPDLRPERVPSEWEASAQYARAAGPAEIAVSASAFTGGVKGMIVWLPDFAFRWSPRNLDVSRRGVDARAEVGVPAANLRVSGAWSVARMTYLRDGQDTDVQVVYRPRHSGLFTAQWAPGPWRAELSARYTGLRYPVPDRVNALPGFWSADLGVSRAWRVGRWAAVTAVDVDRVFDQTQSLIAGYPEPGRRVRFDLRLSRADLHQP
ncbi:MAG TPA: TonB-dependent receptor plug domain-containing protein [Longimicrobium sp.]|nr:TonB-dependent receptor plug domain-containing protein [Longimicrobium sp.]